MEKLKIKAVLLNLSAHPRTDFTHLRKPIARANPFKTKVHQHEIYKFGSYFAENTL
jgi:hypothetical protein